MELSIEQLLAALAQATGQDVTVAAPTAPVKAAPVTKPNVPKATVRKVKANLEAVTGYGKKSGGVDGMKPLSLPDGTQSLAPTVVGQT